MIFLDHVFGKSHVGPDVSLIMSDGYTSCTSDAADSEKRKTQNSWEIRPNFCKTSVPCLRGSCMCPEVP